MEKIMVIFRGKPHYGLIVPCGAELLHETEGDVLREFPLSGADALFGEGMFPGESSRKMKGCGGVGKARILRMKCRRFCRGKPRFVFYAEKKGNYETIRGLHMAGMIDSMFKLKEHGTSLKIESVAGMTTFVTMAYIIFVNPAMLADAGMPREAAFAATVWGAALTTLFMGLWANLPIALAPGMGINAFFAYTVVLGMGLPTTAKYIVLATIAAPAIMHFGVPAMAAHLFILYFGILADLTPPVALAAYAAAGIARSEPNATGFMAVKLALAGFLIPYIFCYNPGLLMIGASGWEVLFYASTAALGIASLSFASVGYWLRNLYWWERLILLAGAITLITPGAITDAIGCGLLVVIYISQKMLTSGPVSKTAG